MNDEARMSNDEKMTPPSPSYRRGRRNPNDEPAPDGRIWASQSFCQYSVQPKRPSPQSSPPGRGRCADEWQS